MRTRFFLLTLVVMCAASAAQAQVSAVLTQQAKLVGTASPAPPFQGSSVALSSDSNTALIGLYNGAYVFTRGSGGNWSQQGTLVGNPESGVAYSVALSADGNTALIGSGNDNNKAGAAWVFARDSTGTWSQVQAPAVPNDPAALFGNWVALSADGDTALIGAPGDNSSVGAVWVFTRDSSMSWTQQGSKLVGNDASGPARQGQSVALSADGNTALSGGPGDNGNLGALWVFTRGTGGTWTQRGSKLVGNDASGTPLQGQSVALSADGNTALSGGTADNNDLGATWVFTRDGNGNWNQQGPKLVGRGSSGTVPLQGWSVAVSADGNKALVGGPFDHIVSAASTGAAWVFRRNTDGSWSQQGPKLVGTGVSGSSGAAGQGYSVALSSGHSACGWTQ